MIFFTALIGCNSKKKGKDKRENDLNHTNQKGLQVATYGKNFDEAGTIPASKIKEKVRENDSIQVKVEGEIVSVCQKKGCWINVELEEGETMQVSFKDYGFFVPKDVAGKTAILYGIAKSEITSVESLKHFAEEAGKSKE